MRDVLEVRAVGVAHALNAVCVLSTFAAAILGHAGQPERAAAHFDLAGVPNRWVQKSWGNTLALPLLALGITVLTYGGAWFLGWARRHPSLLDLRDRDAIFAPRPELQESIWRHMRATIYWLAVPVTLLFLVMLGLGPAADGRLRVWPVFGRR